MQKAQRLAKASKRKSNGRLVSKGHAEGYEPACTFCGFCGLLRSLGFLFGFPPRDDGRPLSYFCDRLNVRSTYPRIAANPDGDAQSSLTTASNRAASSRTRFIIGS